MSNTVALAMIVKGVDEEAVALQRCLQSISPFVDAIYITITYKPGEEINEPVRKVAQAYKANISTFEWVNDFAKARNYNFAQVSKEYDYILWADADDIFEGLEKLKPTIENHPDVDAFGFWYLYDFDEYNQPTVVHKKTQVVKNGSVEWVGALHEDFKETRDLNVQFVEGIRRIHQTDEERIKVAAKRNVEVSEADLKAKPDDPRSYWNYGNSLLLVGEFEKARDIFYTFIEKSESEDEKYLIHQRLSSIEKNLGDSKKAIEHLQTAIGMHPDLPDSYLQLGYTYFDLGLYDKAEHYTLTGLTKQPQYRRMIVYNPRDYDYNPMMLLAKIYWHKSRPDLMLPMLEGCLQIYPKNKFVKTLLDETKKEVNELKQILQKVEKLRKIKDKKKLRKELEKLDPETASHPAICQLRNREFVKETSTGKDIVYYCANTTHQWNPELFEKKGFGGSEEAVINLSKDWAKKGYNVTVYNNCGHMPKTYDGVTYKPYWMFNYRDKQDVVILWRSPRAADYEISADKVFVDLHDVVGKGEFTEKRLAKIDKIFVKTKFHRSLYPSVPDEKIEIVPNGQDFSLFDQKVDKDPYLMINTSSPDRSMDVLPSLFKRVKERVPSAKCKWAYGWDVFDAVHKENSEMKAWKEKINREMAEAGIENLGRLTQKEVAKLYLEANVFAYPTEFAEIDCISVKKAQAGGATPVTTDFGALNESVGYGDKIHSPKTADNWDIGRFSFGLEDEKAQDEWVEACVNRLGTLNPDMEEMKQWTRKFDWENISNKWSEHFNAVQ